MPRFMVTAVGSDRPGVVAALAGVLVEQGCNLLDAQMAVLQGYASMMLVVDCPGVADAASLRDSLSERAADLGHEVWVHSLPGRAEAAPSGHRWVVSVHGSDRPGVVFEVTSLLAGAGINVVDLESRLSGPVASLTMRVDVPTGVDGRAVSDRLDRLGEELGLSCSMRPAPGTP